MCIRDRYKTSTSSLNVPYEIRVAPYGWGQSQDIAAISMGNHSGATGSDDGQIVFKTAYNAHTDANALKESLRINSFGRLMMNHTQTSTPLNDTFLSIYDANSDASAIRPSGVSKNYAMISLHNYGTGVNGDVTGIGFGAGSAFSYTKGSIAFQRQGSYGTGDLVFLTNNDQDTTMVNSTDERMRIRRDGTIRIGGDLYADTDIMMTLRNTAGTGSQIQFHGTGTGNTANDGLRVGYNGTGGQMWLFENGGYLRFATSNNERVRIDEYGAITHLSLIHISEPTRPY